MRRFFIVIFILFILIACRGITNQFYQPVASNSPTDFPLTYSPTVPSPTPGASQTTPIPSLVMATPTISTTAIPRQPELSFQVMLHPDDRLYVGDQVSFEVISPPGLDLKDSKLQVQVDPPAGPILGPISFTNWGIQGREEATLLWAWDTSTQKAGTHSLDFSVQPLGYSWSQEVTLYPTGDMPINQAQAQWESTQSQCCSIFYVTNTASQRDLDTLVTEIDEQARISLEQMEAGYSQPITITVLPRLLGHGGFASDEISVSYLDRNYAANSWSLVVLHELIHKIDGNLGGDFRPTIFVEGLAVYMAGGHYKTEPLLPRAAALLPDHLDWYIPLDTLSNDFYASQHEIGYLEGASLIEYMVDTYGWQAFSAFYRDIHISEGQSQSVAIDAALRAHFSISFSDLEQDYIAAMSARTDTAQWVDDVHITVTFFDTLRRYQQFLDPSAYFRTAWLLDNKTMRERDIVADYLRHPSAPENIALETMFITASQYMPQQEYLSATNILDEINTVLDSIESGVDRPFKTSPLAADYYEICSMLSDNGYEAQEINLNGDVVSAVVTSKFGTELIDLSLIRSGDTWQLSP